MMYPTNEQRCEWAQAALDTFAALTGMQGEDLDTKVTDLLSDLRHLCDRRGTDFRRCVRRSAEHHNAEIDDETGDGEFSDTETAGRPRPPGCVGPPQLLGDAWALDIINLWLSAPEWPNSGIQDICELVRSTGRQDVADAPDWLGN